MLVPLGLLALSALGLVAGSPIPSSEFGAAPIELHRGKQIVRCPLEQLHPLNNAFVTHGQEPEFWGQTTEHVEVVSSGLLTTTLSSLPGCFVHVEDVADLLWETESPPRWRSRRSHPGHFVANPQLSDHHDTYHPLPEILDFYMGLVNHTESIPSHQVEATWIPSIGQSHEGRDLPVIRLRPRFGPQPKRTFFISAGIHAREWVSPATAQYVAAQIVDAYGSDANTTVFLNEFEVVIAPMLNPDGYVFSWEHDRLWRKNRRPADKSTDAQAADATPCVGVDLNRNFDNHWGGVGASPRPCATDYRGPSAASEPETQAVQKFVLEQLSNRSVGLDIHAYGQLILRSFGYTVTPAPNEAVLASVGDGIAAAILAVHGSVYTSMPASGLYPTTGSTDDWYTEQGGMWGWTFELRDTGRYGFRLPPEQIRPTAEEAWAGILYLGQRAAAEGPISN
ncbi:hypothetical protein H696_04566 [Fonticula alba]|uniref:Peptidase M14 domain-containing protein n=1 Tax=Fonticula alba TaxID=691883 RepID=A0A058Z6J4_FONAL|nr:hypothetical protein H696_04566 [Fonticula alba]KCV69152.1 hypothetical protein H696_04566 [Fonticula alba]|eukprot:XP_009496723.1 hypothetical protein H696_04566 [Fonticula alba]